MIEALTRKIEYEAYFGESREREVGDVSQVKTR